jgi:ABC-type sugar transport system substrate-binding protein
VRTKDLGSALAAYQRGGGRLALIGRHTLPGDAIVPENEAGARRLGDHLYGLGHRRIGVIAGPRHLTSTPDRLAGLRAAAKAHGSSIPPKRVRYADFTRDGGGRGGRLPARRGPGPDRDRGLNDAMAVGALGVLRRRGLVGADGRVGAGFDDLPVAADVTPTLTTVSLPLVDMGERAMAMALDEGSAKQRVVRFEAALVVRDSTAPPAPDPLPPPPPAPPPPRPAPRAASISRPTRSACPRGRHLFIGDEIGVAWSPTHRCSRARGGVLTPYKWIFCKVTVFRGTACRRAPPTR